MTSPLCSAREALELDSNYLRALSDTLHVGMMPGARPEIAADVLAVAERLSALASSPPAETGEGVREEIGQIADLIVRDVCELPDRTSPDDWPEAMLVTGEELHVLIVERFAEAALSRGEAAATCKQSLQVHPEAGAPSREAIAAFLKSRDEALGPVGPEHTDEERLESADAILSLFSPQSLKASEREEDHIPRAVPLSTISEGWRPTHRHVKRGTDYQVIGAASLQAGEPVGEAATLVVYRDAKGRLWARPEVEFDDGRFEPLPAPPDSTPDEEAERCLACDKPFKVGDRYYLDVSGGEIHADCCGPERESYTGPDGEPLGPNDPIPEPAIWTAPPALSEGDKA